jgi:hypothetical protein
LDIIDAGRWANEPWWSVPVIGIRQNGRGGAKNEEDGQSRGGLAGHFCSPCLKRFRPMRLHQVAAYSGQTGAVGNARFFLRRSEVKSAFS